jgi:hypothetical protein
MRIDSSGTTTFIKTVNNTEELSFGYGSSSGIYAGIGGKNNFNTNQLCDLLFYTNGSTTSRSPTERMRIDSSGNVGINELDPYYRLHMVFSNATTALSGGTSGQWGSDGIRIENSNTTPGSMSLVHFRNYSADWHVGTKYVNTDDSDFVMFAEAAERLRIKKDGTVLFGGTSTADNDHANIDNNGTLTIRKSSGGDDSIVVKEGSTTSFLVEADGRCSNFNVGSLAFLAYDNETTSAGPYAAFGAFSSEARITAGSTASDNVPLVFRTADGGTEDERMRISHDGEFWFGITTSQVDQSSGSGGHFIGKPGGYVGFARADDPVLYVNRIGGDGTLIVLRHAGTTEGTISSSGSTISYNGGHLSRWSQLANGAARTEILRGSVLSNLDEMCEWGEEDNEQLNRMKVSDVEGDRNVAGVFQAWDDDDDTYTNDFYCAMTGDFVIRIAQGISVERGDLLMSAGDGTAKPQDDDIIRSKTIAKVTSITVSTTYSDGSYCVPCVLMAC